MEVIGCDIWWLTQRFKKTSDNIVDKTLCNKMFICLIDTKTVVAK